MSVTVMYILNMNECKDYSVVDVYFKIYSFF